MAKKIAIALILVVLVGLPLFATGGTEGTEERTTLEVTLFDRGDVETEGPMTQYILENFAEPNNIDFQWKVLPRGQEEAGLTTWMAAGDAPDICFTYSMPLIYKFVVDGGLRPLDDLLEQYGADLVKDLGEEVLQYGVYEGTQYAIPGERPLIGNHMFWIRKDWLDAVGLPLPETREEFYQALVAFKEQDPGGLGDDLVVMGMTSSKWGDQYSNLMTSFLDPRVVNSDRERAGYGWRLYTANVLSTAPGYVEGLRFMNKLHNEGMFHPDWMLETPEISGGKQFVAQLVSGRMGVFSHGYSGIFFYGWAEQIKEQSPHAEWWPIDPFENAEGRYVKKTYTPNAIQTFVPATSSDESAATAVKYLNFLSLRDPRPCFLSRAPGDLGGAPHASRY